MKKTWKVVHIARAGPKTAVDTPAISGDIPAIEASKIAKIAYLDDPPSSDSYYRAYSILPYKINIYSGVALLVNARYLSRSTRD